MKKSDNTIYDFLLLNQIINVPNLNDFAINNWGNNIENIYLQYESYLMNIHGVNSPGPIEKHPYLDLYENDFDLQRQNLLLGTFPPSSYFNNLPLNNIHNANIQNTNPTHYYYGNTNSLWSYLFQLNNANFEIPFIQELLFENSISISDVFAYIQRKKMISPSDSDLKNIVINSKIMEIFNSHSNIQTLLFTSGQLTNFLENTTSTLTGFRWILEEHFDGLNNFTISGNIHGNGPYFPINNAGLNEALNQQNGGIIWWIKSPLKKIRIINLPSPSNNASIQMMTSPYFKKWIQYKANLNNLEPFDLNANVTEYLSNHPGVFFAPYTIQFRQEVYQMFLNETLHLI